ncbi:MAG: Flp family type IVb pilin [Sphingomicrobium sp.]
MPTIVKLLKDKRGIGAIEYALVASLISVAALAGYQSLGSQVGSSFSNIDQTLAGKI